MPPVADRRPTDRVHHGDRFPDPYEWLRAKDDPQVIAYLEAENSYTEARTAHLMPLRDAIFSEIKARTLETDLTVPSYATHRDGSAFWYYARTVEGSEYSIYCRAPATDQRRPPDITDTISGEQVLLDGNVEAAGQGVLRPRCVQRLGRRPTAGVLGRPQRRRALHVVDQGPGDRRAAAGPDRGHGVRSGLGPGQPPLLYPGRRGVASPPGAAAPAGHRPGRGRHRARRARRAVLARCRQQP